MTTFTATIEKTRSAAPVIGVYRATAIDAAKAAADIRITAAGSTGYSIFSKVALKGRGIASFNNGNYTVTDAALDRLKLVHTVACDF